MTPEGIVKTKVRKILDAYKAHYFMPVSNGMGRMGCFDFVCCIRGLFVGIECKATEKNKPTALQSAQAEKTIEAGGVVFLAHSGNMVALVSVLEEIYAGTVKSGSASVWPFDSAK